MRPVLDVFSFRGVASRALFIAAGLVLLAIKFGIDALVAARFHEAWNPLMYVSLRISPLFRNDASPSYVATLLAVSLPFVWAGVALCVRRLRDMGVHPFWAGLFFLPLLHYAFFVILAVSPSKTTPEEAAPIDPYRTQETAAPIPAPQRLLMRWTPRTESRAVVVGIVLAASMATVAYLLTHKQTLGIGLFVGLPFGMGFVTAFCAAFGGRVSLSRSLLYACASEVVGLVILLAFAWEGVACIVMALPIFTGLTLLGGFFGWMCAGAPKNSATFPALSCVVLAPVLAMLDGHRDVPPEHLSVVSEVTIAAPPDVVWKNVVAFPPIDEPPEAIFAIVAMPIEAKIDGSEPGATRRCVFTNGTFVEPITTWRAPEELSFRVQEQPGNLDRYLDVERGQFLLIDNHDGTTTLRGTTWYDLKVFPASYWKWWSELFLHRIHLRVLRHVKKISEHPEAATGVAAQMPAWMKEASYTCKCTTASSATK